jgi:hypothetical protein
MHAASQLATNVRLQLSGSSPNSASNAPAPLPTASLPAYKAYLVSERLGETQLKQSAAMLRRATELDPNFADAWESLSLEDHKLRETKRAADDLRQPSLYAINSTTTKKHALKRVITWNLPLEQARTQRM